ncbi:MAG: hypothetical protein ACLQDV_05995 [Candidatus Binataceae bacterium]
MRLSVKRSLLLVGHYEGRKLYVAKVRAGLTPALRESVFKQVRDLETRRCPFRNLPESRRGQWGEGLTADQMAGCRWLKPKMLAKTEYLEWTAANHLRHANLFRSRTARHVRLKGKPEAPPLPVILRLFTLSR